MEEFRVKFNKGKQFITVFVWDVHPTTFNNWNETYWAYFEPKWTNPKSGFFGEFHVVKSGIREDTIAHELFHVLCEYIWATRDNITSRNEERFATLMDELTRNFYKGLKKLEEKCITK